MTIAAVVPPLAAAWVQAAARTGARPVEPARCCRSAAPSAPRSSRAGSGPCSAARCSRSSAWPRGWSTTPALDDPDDVVVEHPGPPDLARTTRSAWSCPTTRASATSRPGEVGALLTRGPYTIRGYYRAERAQRDARSPPTASTAPATWSGATRAGNIVVDGPREGPDQPRRREDRGRGGGEPPAGPPRRARRRRRRRARRLPRRAHLRLRHPGARPGAARAPRQLRRFVRDRGVAAYKVPDRVEVVDAFPATGVGKISQRALRAALADHARRPTSGTPRPRRGEPVVSLPDHRALRAAAGRTSCRRAARTGRPTPRRAVAARPRHAALLPGPVRRAPRSR